MGTKVLSYTDSDWTGDKETPNVTSAGVSMMGDHMVTARTRRRKIIARRSAEAELHWAI